MLSRMGNNSCGVKTMWLQLGQQTQLPSRVLQLCLGALSSLTFGTRRSHEPIQKTFNQQRTALL